MGIKCMLSLRTPQDTLYCYFTYSLAAAVSLKMNCMGNEQFKRTSVHLIKSNGGLWHVCVQSYSFLEAN